MNPVWPLVHDALLAGLPLLPAFADVPVYDGMPVTGDSPPAWVTVGFVTDEGAGAFQQDLDPSGFATTETGSVVCHIAANAGDGDPSITRTTAFGLFAAWQTWAFNNPTLDGRIPSGQVLNLSAQVDGVQNPQGSATGLIVTVTYQSTTFTS